MKPHAQPDLQEIRSRIDALDRKLVEVLAERQAAVEDVARIKAVSGLPTRDAIREQEKLMYIGQFARTRGVNVDLVQQLLREIMDFAVRLQEEQRTRSR